MAEVSVTVPALPGLTGLGSAWLREYAKAAIRQGWHPAGPLGVMYAESRLQPKANNDGVAVGLLQWTKAGAPASGLPATEASLRHILGLSAIEQLPLVERYFKGVRYSQPSDYWLRAIGRADLAGAPNSQVVYRSLASLNCAKGFETSPIYQKASPSERQSHKFYCGNQGLDTNADGTITVGEMRAKFEGLMGHAKGKTVTVSVDPSSPFEADEPKRSILPILFLAGIAATGYKVMR